MTNCRAFGKINSLVCINVLALSYPGSTVFVLEAVVFCISRPPSCAMQSDWLWQDWMGTAECRPSHAHPSVRCCPAALPGGRVWGQDCGPPTWSAWALARACSWARCHMDIRGWCERLRRPVPAEDWPGACMLGHKTGSRVPARPLEEGV